jgi:hypothetical protein
METGVFVGGQQETVGLAQPSMLDVMGKYQHLQLLKLSRTPRKLFLVDLRPNHGLVAVRTIDNIVVIHIILIRVVVVLLLFA